MEISIRNGEKIVLSNENCIYVMHATERVQKEEL